MYAVSVHQVADWDLNDFQMKLVPSAVEDSTFQRTRDQATFLGSESAPDGAQVRRSLHEMHEDSLRRKSYATCAAAGCMLLAVLLTQRAATHAARETTSRLAP
jgi:hypothetical protein